MFDSALISVVLQTHTLGCHSRHVLWFLHRRADDPVHVGTDSGMTMQVNSCLFLDVVNTSCDSVGLTLVLLMYQCQDIALPCMSMS